MRSPEHKERSDHCQTAPLSLTPSPFPGKLFKQGMSVQTAMNLLYYRVSLDADFLVQAHREVVRTDEYIRQLVYILDTTRRAGAEQKHVLLTQRADYMCHQEERGELQLKQIEVNNIAVRLDFTFGGCEGNSKNSINCSMGGLAQLTTPLHRRIVRKLMGWNASQLEETVPHNQPIHTLATGLWEAWKAFNQPTAWILVVVEGSNQNQPDQRFVEFAVEEHSHGQVRFIRLTLAQCDERLSLAVDSGGDGQALLVDGGKMVGVVYFRAGYTPSQYPTTREWSARLLIERSSAIKCPSISLLLANTKKMQQVLSDRRLLGRFFDPGEEDMADAVHATFAGLWGFGDGEEGCGELERKKMEEAIANPHRFVLKPNLEGGGGNFYGEEVAVKLKEFSAHERSAHILMQRITPLVVKVGASGIISL